jgi:hypothetical protein
VARTVYGAPSAAREKHFVLNAFRASCTGEVRAVGSRCAADGKEYKDDGSMIVDAVGTTDTRQVRHGVAGLVPCSKIELVDKVCFRYR